jgi:hypothetical protein
LLFEQISRSNGYLSFLVVCLGHRWICQNGVSPDRAPDPAVLSRLKQFSAMNKLQKMALRVSTYREFRLFVILHTKHVWQ